VAASEATGAIEIEGRRFAWRALGAGPPLLLINGYAATRADWDPAFLAGLAAEQEVICPDNRGLGGSELGDGELTIDAMAADLEALLDARGLASVAVAGWSMGGFVAQQLARRAPARVEALALISTDPGGPSAVLADPAVWARLTDASGSDREQASRLIALLFPPALAPTIDRDFGAIVAAGRAALSPAALRAQERAMEAWHREEPPAAAAEAPPTLVVHGGEDEVIPAANAELLAARWPGAEVEIVAGAAHAVMAQEAARVSGAVVSLLADRR
jgi:pimeloyl-ACP methyl ester carboxylesterase